MKLCEKCKKDGPKYMVKGNCCHIYQRRYYAKNKEKCREYQREYQQMYRKSKRKGGRDAAFIRPLVPEKKEYNSSDLMHLSVEKWPMVVGNIANGYYLFNP